MPPSTISADMLARVGRALYGNQWQTALARDLNISGRLVRYMAAGQRRMSAPLVAKLISVVETRRDDLAGAADELRIIME